MNIIPVLLMLYFLRLCQRFIHHHAGYLLFHPQKEALTKVAILIVRIREVISCEIFGCILAAVFGKYSQVFC